MTDSHTTAPAVQRRRVHYFSGFDPRGPAHYHRLCQTEAAKPQPQGGVVQVSPREKQSRLFSRWQVSWQASADAPETVHTEHVFMGWDDMIRANWSRSPWALATEFAQTYAHIFRHVGAARVWRMYRPAFNTGALPLLVLIGPLLITALLAALLGAWGALGGLLLAIAVWGVATRAGLFWLLRIFTFFMRMGRSPLPGLQERCQSWVDDIVARQQADPVDEVLIAGHSVGTLMLVHAVDALLADQRWQALQQGRPTAVLTLGQSSPMVAMAPGATDFRAALQRLSHHTAVCWWDVTARIDPLCFYNLHPLAGSGVPHAQAPWPVRHTARFMHMYAPASWARIRANKLQAHFLYLATAERVGNFAFMDVFYGPRTLQQQMADKGTPRHA